MSFRSHFVTWLDENAPSVIGAARYHYHVGIKREIVYPAVTQALFSRLGSGNATAIDVGANVGIFTRYLASHFASVIAVEPIPYLADRLGRSSLANVKVEPVALGGSSGSVCLRVPIDVYGNEMAALSTAAHGNKLAFIENSGFVERQVSMKTLDEIAAQCSSLAFVKIDVEGFEASVLEGSVDVLQRERPVIQLEISRAHNPDYNDVLSLFEGVNYRIFALQKDGLYLGALSFIQAQPVSISDEDAASPNGCWDYLFVPSERVEFLTSGLVRGLTG
jgi:FkbM family methyltransferase